MSTSLADGQIFAKRYQVIRCIGSGGMGAVYEVIHLETERHRALKVMHGHFSDSAEFRERFKREARVAAQIDSQYIVDIFDAGVDEETQMPFLVMELLRGEELAKTLKRVGRLPAADVVTCLFQTALALDKTHRALIVHRDLKPENLFLCERDDGPPRIKVLDFGIAKLASSGAASAHTTNSVGTPLYMAPEQFQAGGYVSPTADIYALGLLAYTLLVGDDYWHEELSRDENIFAFAVHAMRGPTEAPSVRARRQGVALPPGFDAWFARATAASPLGRFAKATEAVRELAQALSVALPASRGALPSVEDVIYDVPISTSNYTSRTTPAASAATMPLAKDRLERRGGGRFLLVSVGVLGLAAAAFVSLRGVSSTRADTPAWPTAPAAAVTVSAPTVPSADPSKLDGIPSESPVVNAELQPADAPLASARMKPKKAPPSPVVKAPVKPIYSRD
ncbi:MAG TPA: serine/threonine-protein kinase [Polyangiaceae bacterium]